MPGVCIISMSLVGDAVEDISECCCPVSWQKGFCYKGGFSRGSMTVPGLIIIFWSYPVPSLKFFVEMKRAEGACR